MQTTLLRLLALLAGNSHARSFLLGLTGVLGTYVTQWFSGQDFGPFWTPLLAAGLPVLANSLRKLLGGSSPDGDDPHDDTVDSATLRPGGGTALRSLLLIGLLCLPIAGHAASPKAVIKGPRTAVPGEFLKYDFSSSTGMKGFRLEVDPKLAEARPELAALEQVRLLKEEKAAEVASFRGVWRLKLTVWDEADDSDVAEWIYQ